MPKKICSNLVENKILVGKTEVEDVQNVVLPDLTKVSADIDAMGMVGKLSIPDPAHYEQMTMTIEHNRGLNHEKLRNPGRLDLEFRNAIHVYNNTKGEMEYKSEKYRIRALHKSSKEGKLARGNTRSTAETYSVLRYEMEENGKIVLLIDVVSGIVKIGGENYTEKLNALLK